MDGAGGDWEKHGKGERQLDGGTVSVTVPCRDGISDLGKHELRCGHELCA